MARALGSCCLRAASVALALGSTASAADELSARERADIWELELLSATHVQREVAGASTEGAVATAFRVGGEDGTIRKIVFEIYGELGRRSRMIYYDAGRPFYAVGAEWAYSVPVVLLDDESDIVMVAAGGRSLGDEAHETWSSGPAGHPMSTQEDAADLAASLLRLMGAPAPAAACIWECAEGALPACMRFRCAE